ncbi:MAG: CBS domain-containing protein [Gammaproteobacteria bacterium]
MIRKPTLASAMTPFPLAIDLNAQVQEADQMMRKHGIHHLPVTDGRTIIGTLSAYDIAARAHHDMPVADCYVPEPYLVEIDVPLETVLAEMAAHHLEATIVMRQGRLAGIFTQHDVCRTFAAFLHVVFPPPPDDEAA